MNQDIVEHILGIEIVFMIAMITFAIHEFRHKFLFKKKQIQSEEMLRRYILVYALIMNTFYDELKRKDEDAADLFQLFAQSMKAFVETSESFPTNESIKDFIFKFLQPRLRVVEGRAQWIRTGGDPVPIKESDNAVV